MLNTDLLPKSQIQEMFLLSCIHFTDVSIRTMLHVVKTYLLTITTTTKNILICLKLTIWKFVSYHPGSWLSIVRYKRDRRSLTILSA